MVVRDQYWTAAQVAEYVQVPKRTVDGWRLRPPPGGGPPWTKAGAAVRYRRSDVEAWLAQQRRESLPA